jgi:uncharacterized protein YjlB
MSVIETAKKHAEKWTGVGRPDARALQNAVRARKPGTFLFKDDGQVPNHPLWPFIHYRSPVDMPEKIDPAALLEDLFERNGWGDAWRDGVYDYLHYHSRIHEVMGVARGTAVVRFGGNRGRKIRLKAGDVVILPAGTGHQRLFASHDFLVVGAYPATGTYDLCRPSPGQERREGPGAPQGSSLWPRWPAARAVAQAVKGRIARRSE